MRDKVYCIICQDSLHKEPGAFPTPTPDSALSFLCKLFKLPPIDQSLLDNLKETAGSSCKLCRICGKIIEDAMRTDTEMKLLELKLRKIKREIWSCIASIQRKKKNTRDAEIPPSVTAVGKYYGQCLGECEVRLRRLTQKDLKRHLKSNTGKKKQFSTPKIVDDCEDDLVIVPFYDENVLSPDDYNEGNFEASSPAASETEIGTADKPLSSVSSFKDDHITTEESSLEQPKTEEDSQEQNSVAVEAAVVESAKEEQDQSPFPVAGGTGQEGQAAHPPPAAVNSSGLEPCSSSPFSEPEEPRPSPNASAKWSRKSQKKKPKEQKQIGRRYTENCKYCGFSYADYRQPSTPEGNPNGSNKPQYSYVCNPSVCCDRRYPTLRHFYRHHHRKCSENPYLLKDKVARMVARYRCDQCNKMYTSALGLQRHVEEIHEKNYRFCCEVCGRGFMQACHLQLHMVKHVPERRHKCDQCDKTFSRADGLRQHKRTHTGELPYICEICGKGFHKQFRLPMHLENVHGEAKYPCDVCGKMFRSKLYVGFHKKNVHGIKRKGGTKGGEDNCNDVTN